MKSLYLYLLLQLSIILGGVLVYATSGYADWSTRDCDTGIAYHAINNTYMYNITPRINLTYDSAGTVHHDPYHSLLAGKPTYYIVAYFEDGIWKNLGSRGYVYQRINVEDAGIADPEIWYQEGLTSMSQVDAVYLNTIDLTCADLAPLPECEAKEGTKENFYVEGLFPDGPFCVNSCEVIKLPDDGIEISGETHTLIYGEYTGQECSGDEQPAPNLESPPEDCSEFIDKCMEACRGSLDAIMSCDTLTGEKECTCDLPPFPLSECTDGTLGPDQDKDGICSEEDDDVDGDGTDNRNDNDVDGDGDNNGSDGDTNGDGEGNDGSEDTWDHDYPTDGDGTGADSDIDGDGTDNCADEDMDGDGVLNESDSDTDGDGIYNYSDPAPNGGCGGGPNPDDPIVTSPDNDENDDTGELGGDNDEFWIPGNRSINFKPIHDATSVMKTKFPISLVDDIVTMANQFQGSPQAPVFEGEIFGGYPLRIDLSVWDPFATIFRGLMALLIIATLVTTLIRQWSN